YRTANLLTLTTWCRDVGARLLDEQLDPEEVLRGTLVPELVSERPKKMPIAAEWPAIFYKEPEQYFSFEINGATIYLHEAEINLIDPDDSGPLTFAVSSSSVSANFELRLGINDDSPDYCVHTLDGTQAVIRHRGGSISLREFFEDHPPTFWFADGSSLTGIEYVPLRKQPEPFPRERIRVWDWNATKIRIESQGIERNPVSIQ